MINFGKIRFGNVGLKVKFGVIAVMVSLAGFGVATLLSARWMAQEVQQDHEEKAMLISTHIIHDLGSSMLRRSHDDIFQTLDIYRAYKEVEEVRLFNREGKGVFPKGQDRSETKVDEVLKTGKPLKYDQMINHRKVATFILPIKNQLECHACHGATDPLRGAVLLSLQQEAVEQYIRNQTFKFITLFALLTLVVGATAFIIVRKFILNPLKSIQEGVQAIEKGDFHYQIPVTSDDEIGSLARGFNHMAHTLRSFFKEVEDKNRQLIEQCGLVSLSQKEWQETFDSITDLICLIDREFNVLKANRAFKEYFSIPLIKEINRKCHDILGTCERSECFHLRSMQEERPFTSELRDQKTGRIFQASFFPYYSQEGAALGSIFVAKDITEKKEYEMRLILNERLSALGEMASSIAHEINNPLATIMACSEGLLKRVKNRQIDSSLFETYLKIIDEETQRTKNITSSMLSFVRHSPPGKQAVDVSKTLDKTLIMFGFLGRLKEVNALKRYSNEKLLVYGNEGELRQVFQSIIGNALDAMNDKGLLTLEAGIDNGSVFIKVSDTGPGIPPNLMAKIFTPFFTTKLGRGGTGLGLTIAQKIIEENQGKIEVSSEEGRGATFTVLLPKA